MMPPATLIRTARRTADLTQAELADRAGTTQSVIARLERPGSNPTVETLDRILSAAGHRLELDATELRLPPVDENQILRHLRMTPAERLATFTASHRHLRELLGTARLVDPAEA
jgi:transcriptional regulator with XRE-family HTH domain